MGLHEEDCCGGEDPTMLDCLCMALEIAKAQSGTEPVGKDVTSLLDDAQKIWDWTTGVSPTTPPAS